LETSNGTLWVAWYAYPEAEHINATLVLTKKEPGQTQWVTCTNVVQSKSGSLGNPVLFEDPNGTLWLLYVVLKGTYWTDAELNATQSQDGGLTWQQPTCIWPHRGMMVRHPPVVRADRSLLLPAYDEIRHRTVLLLSQPPYTQWEILYTFRDLEIIQPALVRESPQRLTLIFRPWGEPRVIWRSHSADDGRTWTTPMRTALPNPLSGVAALHVGSHLAVVYNNNPNKRHPLSIAVSRDGGTSWSAPQDIDAIDKEISYPQFINAANGRILGVYTYNRKMIKFVSFPEQRLLGAS
jgi:predicted neuraminidase